MREEPSLPGPAGGNPRQFSLAPPPIPLHVTSAARDALVELLRVRPRGCVVHLLMVLDQNPHPNLLIRPATRGQLVFEQDGVPFVVEAESCPYFREAVIDHTVEEGFASFQIEGPNFPRRSPTEEPTGSKH